MARGGAAKEAANDIGRAELKTVVDNRPVGEILSEARIARDMDYADVAAQLRIRRTYIEAIEDGRLGDLPGSTYAIGFVRTYAELMELDVPKIVAKFKQEAAEFEDRTQLVFPEPMPGTRGPTVSVILIAVLMLAGAYGGWLYVSNKDRDTIELVPPLPESLSRLLSQSSIGEAPSQSEAATAAESAAQTEASTATEQPSQQPVTSIQPVPQVPATETTSVEFATQPTIVNETIASAPAVAATAPEAAPEGAQEAAPETAATVGAEIQAAAPAAQPMAASTSETAAATQETATQQVETTAATAATQVPVAAQTEQVAVATPESTSESTPAAAPAEPAVPAQQSAAAAEPVQQAASEETELPTVGGSQPSSFGTESTASRIVIRAVSPSWVEITAADGKVLLNRLLRTGDTFRVPDRTGIKLVTGSAGGLEFTVDGKVAPKIGAVGDVRRDVLLEPDALLKAQ